MPEDFTGVNFTAINTADKEALTISSGDITPTAQFVIVAAQTGTADDLDGIVTSSILSPGDADGAVIYLMADAGDTITIRHNQNAAATKNILTETGSSVTLTGNAVVRLIYNIALDTNGTWVCASPSSALHTKYTNAEAISAVEGEATLDLAGDVTIANAKGLVIGHTAQITSGANPAELQVLGTGDPDAQALLARFGANAFGPILTFMKTRQASIGANDNSGIVSDNDAIGAIRFMPDDGADFDTQAAVFQAEVDDASPAAGDIGMAFVWELMPGGGGAIRNVMRLSAAGELILSGAEATGTGLLLGTTSPVEIFRSAANTLRLDTKVSDAFMTLNGTTQAFGPAITTVQFLNLTAVTFVNAIGGEIVKFSDATAGTASAEFTDVAGTPTLLLAGDIDIAGHIAIGAAASVDTVLGKVLVIAETSTATASRGGADGQVNQLSITHTYTPTSISSSTFRGLRMEVIAGGDQDIDGVFLAGATALQFLTQHDSNGDINQIVGAQGQTIIGNNPLDSVSSKKPHLDGFASQGIGVGAALIWSSHSGSTETATLDSGAASGGVKGIDVQLILRTFQDSGTLTMINASGQKILLDLSDAHTLTNKITITNLNGLWITNASSASVTITTAKLLKLDAWDSDPTYTNGPYAISQEGVGDVNWLAAYTYVGGAAIPSLALANNSALTVDQDASAGAIPVLTLDQADVSEEMMEFITTIGTGNAIEAVAAKTLTTTHFIKVTIPGGLTRYIPVGTIA